MQFEALGHASHHPLDVDIRSSALCYCLAKGPDAVGELRRITSDWFAKGLLAFAAQKHDKAIAAFSKVVQLNPRDARAFINRGIVYAKTGDYQQARADLKKAVALEPQLAQAYYATGLVSVLLGDKQQAEQDFRIATQLGYEPARSLNAGNSRHGKANGLAMPGIGQPSER
jgi:Flp pilus assembly protein TadD